jgi:hypothetical protein
MFSRRSAPLSWTAAIVSPRLHTQGETQGLHESVYLITVMTKPDAVHAGIQFSGDAYIAAGKPMR